MSRSSDKLNVALITQPLGEGGVPILKNYLELIAPVVGQIYSITDDFPSPSKENIHVLRIAAPDASNKPLPLRILRLLWIQVKICSHLLKVSPKVTVVIFHIGSDLYLLPMVVAKLLGKKMVRFVVGRHSHFARVEYGRLGIILLPIFRIIEKLSFGLADQINVLSRTGIEAMGLGKYRNKVAISGAQYINTDVFQITKPPEERRNLVGHIGGLGPRKGALNFARAIPLVLKERDNIEFLIAGGSSPSERDRIKQELEGNNLGGKVELGGWVPDEEFPVRLNELKLFILASYEEGLPAAVQQAMACGAVPLVTPVGGIPDLVKDGETGFILKDNSPQTIATTIIRALEHPELAEIARNARRLIEQEYSYERSVARCRDALSQLVKS